MTATGLEPTSYPLEPTSYHLTYVFHHESTLYSCLNVKQVLAQSMRESSSLSDCNGTRTINEQSTIYSNWPNNLAVLGVLICMVHLNVCSYHVTQAFQSEYTLYSCLNVKEFLALSRHKICSLRECDWTRTHNH